MTRIPESMIENAIDRFDTNAVRKMMTAIGWSWGDERPTGESIRSRIWSLAITVRDLADSASPDEWPAAWSATTGGLFVEFVPGELPQLEVRFIGVQAVAFGAAEHTGAAA